MAAGLAAAVSRDAGDVPDPYAGTLDDFRAMFTLVQRAVMALGERLAAGAMAEKSA